MIKTILGHLQSGVEKLESGHLSPEDMELLVEDAKELYERMVILRYKIYETNVLGVKEAVISASIRHTEIETPIDLFGSIDEPTPEPAFEVTFASGQSDELNAAVFNDELEDNLEEELEEAHIEEEQEEEEAHIEEEQEEEEEHIEEQEVEEEEQIEEEQEERIEEKEEDRIDDEEEELIEHAAPSNWEPEFSGDQPIWMAEMEANIRDNRSVFPLESLIGAFTLNEKLQFINELFDGSSDDFSSNVKQLDQLASIDAARNMIAELADTYTWDTDSEIVEDFMYKICRRYATGA
jgi:flagellar biosynthesis GTPase FlhF